MRICAPRSIGSSALLLLLSAGLSANAAPTGDPPDPPLPVITAHTEKMTQSPAPKVSVTRRFVEDDHELLEVWVPIESLDAVDVSRGGYAAAFIGPTYVRGGTMVLLRRPLADSKKPLAGDLYARSGAAAIFDARRAGAEAYYPYPQSWHAPFDAVDEGGKTDPKLAGDFWQAATNRLGQGSDDPFHAFVHARLEARGKIKGHDYNGRPTRPSENDVARLMETTTGATSIQEALQYDRPLWAATVTDKKSVPLSALKGPALAVHPFAKMLAALPPSSAAPPVERLAEATPADFYFLRFTDLSVLFRLLDQGDAWATPLANALDSRAQDRHLAERYLAQLGLDRGPLSRALGTTVIGELAAIGSDPYLREGSDVTLLFRVKQKLLFDSAVAATLNGYTPAHGPLTARDYTVGDVTVHTQHTADGAVRQERATIGDLEIVSNSAGAMARVLAAVAGKEPRLADEPDLRFMLARDAAVRADAFAFMGDRFVASVVGPRQKILEARRQLALAALSRPGYAALLYGWMEGTTAPTLAALLKSGWLDGSDLTLPDGSKIDFTVGQAARSLWGSPAALTPLIDLPTPATVTADERAGYEWFARSYEGYWRSYMDPTALRISVIPAAGGTTRIAVDLRALPFIDGSDYNKLRRAAGDARVTAPELPRGIRWLVGIGKDAELRRDLSGLMRNVFSERFTVDWLGTWAVVGLEDRTPIAVTARNLFGEQLEPGGKNELRDAFDTFVRQPIYAGVAISGTAGAALFLAAARKLALDAAPGIVQWEPFRTHKKAHIVRISVNQPADQKTIPNFSVYYALLPDRFYISLNVSTLERLIDAAPVSGALAGRGSQLLFDVTAPKGGALASALGWMIESAVLQATRHVTVMAEAIFRGAPETQKEAALFARMAQAYFGAVPVSPDGGSFSYEADGVHDSVRGSAFARVWPAQPVPGSPAARLLAAVSVLRCELAFDAEKGPPPTPTASEDDERRAGMESLHARVSFVVH